MGDCETYLIIDGEGMEYYVDMRLDNNGEQWIFDFEEFQQDNDGVWGMDSTFLAGVLAKLNELNGIK